MASRVTREDEAADLEVRPWWLLRGQAGARASGARASQISLDMPLLPAGRAHSCTFCQLAVADANASHVQLAHAATAPRPAAGKPAHSACSPAGRHDKV